MRIARLVDVKRSQTLEGMEFCIDLPLSGMALMPLELTVSGWLKDFECRLEEVSIWHEELFKKIPISRTARADLSNGSSEPNLFGYEFGINLGRLNFPEVIDVYAHFSGLPPTLFCSMVVEYVDVPGRVSRTPLLITALGRSGSSHLMELLSTHPAIAVAGLFPYEERIASYFCEFFHSTTRFRSTAEGLPRYLQGSVLPFNPLIKPANLQDLNPDERFSFTRDLLTVCANDVKELVDLHYSNLCARSAKEAPVFAEKLIGAFHTQELISSIYQTGVEVILVRDFRDAFTSAMMFNQKRGYPAFGRERWKSDAEWLVNFANDAERIMNASKLRPDALVVKYEELVEVPEQILRKVWSRLGISMVESINLRDTRALDREFHRTSVSGAESISRWKRDLPDDLIEIANDKLKDCLLYFDYEPRSRPPRGKQQQRKTSAT